MDTRAALALNDAAMVVIFRGSQDPFVETVSHVDAYRDWIVTDLDVKLAQICVSGRSARVHSGFWRAFSAVADDLTAGVEAIRGGDSLPLWITGHSLGGALATLAAVCLHAHGVEVTGLCTFGCPRVGDASFARLFRRTFSGACHRYVHANDPVPMLPPRGMDYVHVTAPHVIAADGALRLSADQPDAPRLPLRHRVEHYVRALHLSLPDDERADFPAPRGP